MVFYNISGLFGQVIQSGSVYLTGSETVTMLIILLVMVIFTFLFRIPFEFGMLLLTPFIIVLMAFNTAFLIWGGIFLLLEAIIMTRMFFLN